jgi:hypothetical protein
VFWSSCTLNGLDERHSHDIIFGWFMVSLLKLLWANGGTTSRDDEQRCGSLVGLGGSAALFCLSPLTEVTLPLSLSIPLFFSSLNNPNLDFLSQPQILGL